MTNYTKKGLLAIVRDSTNNAFSRAMIGSTIASAFISVLKGWEAQTVFIAIICGMLFAYAIGRLRLGIAITVERNN